MTMNESLTERREAEVRMEIDESRERLGQTVDAIGDKVLPNRIIERRKERTASGLRSLRERFMGTASQASHQIGGTASDTMGQVRHAPDALAERTEGSPLAVGAVAFTIGLLAAAVMKPSEPERRAVEKLTDAAPELRSGMEEVGRDLATTVKEHAAEVAGEVKSTVAESADAVASAATDGGQSSN
jgi:ElaB/YqjD/DUF883 family membrane-anchored ribosome-binding protein